MRRSLLQVMCVVVLLCVCWIVIHPDFDVEPTVFRFAAFAALTLFLLRRAFKYARPALVFSAHGRLSQTATEIVTCRLTAFAAIPLRC